VTPRELERLDWGGQPAWFSWRDKPFSAVCEKTHPTRAVKSGLSAVTAAKQQDHGEKPKREVQ